MRFTKSKTDKRKDKLCLPFLLMVKPSCGGKRKLDNLSRVKNVIGIEGCFDTLHDIDLFFTK